MLARPEVVVKEENGVKMEPFEHLVVDVPAEFQGVAIEKLGKRKANMTQLTPMPDGTVRLEFEIPARGLIGFRNEFLTDTKGEGIMNHSYLEYRAYSGKVESRTPGALVSMDDGEAAQSLTYKHVVLCLFLHKIKFTQEWLLVSLHVQVIWMLIHLKVRH